jgi:hypothetical protein
MATIESPPESAAMSLPFSFDHDDTSKLLVGEREHVLIGHASFITRDSDFFKAALKKEWPCGQTRVIKSPEELPHVVSFYLNHTYTKEISVSLTKTYSSDTVVLEPSEYTKLLAELYVLGERLLDRSIRYTVTENIMDLADFQPINEPVNIIYGGTTAASPARQLMVDIYLRFGSKDWLDDTYDAAFLLDAAQAFCSKAETNSNPGSYRKRKFPTTSFHMVGYKMRLFVCIPHFSQSFVATLELLLTNMLAENAQERRRKGRSCIGKARTRGLTSHQSVDGVRSGYDVVK